MKTILTKVHLINWYGFIDEIIPVSPELTLISGENECGKSTILDAIKYAYTGDTLFNKSSAGVTQGLGKRNIFSYTRCLLDASASKYARSPETVPLVYTHIALEYKNEPEDRSFVLGVIIETGAADVRSSDWYAIDQMTIDELALTYEEEGQIKPYGKELFQKRYRTPMMGKKEGIERFMQMVGLKLPYAEVNRYQRKLRNIMTYNPEAKIREFIKESVLEEFDINFTKLRDAKNNIDDITRKLDLIDREIRDLDDILGGFAEYDRLEGRLTVDEIKSVYKLVCDGEKHVNEITIAIEKEAMEIDALGRQIRVLDEKYREADELYIQANRELQESDVARAISTAEQTVARLEERWEALNQVCEELKQFERELDEAVEWLREMGEEPIERVALLSVDIAVAEKESYVKRSGELFSSFRDKNVSEKALVGRKLYEIEEELRHEKEVIIACDKNKPDYSYASEQMALVSEINREFDKEGIPERARLACEYVVGFTDESWRDAIEAFLGVHRFAVLVEPEHFSVANRVMDRSSHRYVELINTPLLMKKEIKPKENSVYEKLIIKNETAASYFCFWLGRIRAVAKDDVVNHTSAMSKEGKLSRNMAVTFINKRNLKTYALGSEAILLNKKKAEKRIVLLNEEKEKVLGEEAVYRSRIEKLDRIRGLFKEYSWEAPAELLRVKAETNREKERLYELREAQKNNAEFIALSERVSRLREDVNRISEERSDHVTRQATLKGRIEADKEKEKTYRYTLEQNTEKLEEWKDRRSSAAETAIRDYDGFLAGENTSGDVMKTVTRERNERELRRLSEDLSRKQIEYNNRNQSGTQGFPVGVEHEAVYQRRREKIWVDDLQVMREKFREQTDRYEDIFKKEFVLTIFDKAQTAIRDLRDINRELRRLTFTTQYRFEVKMLEDGSDYARIIAYARYLQDTNNLAAEGQRLMTEAVGIDAALAEQHENEIREIINRLIEQDDDKEIKKYADYRNYMSYEIIINDDHVKDGKLSKQMGYNSGAGTQIPYTLILSASLSMLYNVRSNSTRLVFIDEPFEKMSDVNIERMLEFFKSQDFQVVFCAPPNKLEAIGTKCGVIIPVIKYANQDMRIGEVRFMREG